MEYAAQLINIYKSFPKKDVLNGITLTVPLGSFTILTGRTGTGKTTILKIMAGSEQAEKGEFRLLGKPVRQYKNREFSSLVSFLPANSQMVDFLTLEEHIQLKNKQAGLMKDASWTQELMEELELTECLFRRAGDLSGGERQKALLLLALISRPALLLADEPVSCLDEMSVKQVIRTIRKCQEQFGMAVVAASHDLRSAKQGDQLLELLNGKIRHVTME